MLLPSGLHISNSFESKVKHKIYVSRNFIANNFGPIGPTCKKNIEISLDYRNGSTTGTGKKHNICPHKEGMLDKGSQGSGTTNFG